MLIKARFCTNTCRTELMRERTARGERDRYIAGPAELIPRLCRISFSYIIQSNSISYLFKWIHYSASAKYRLPRWNSLETLFENIPKIKINEIVESCVYMLDNPIAKYSRSSGWNIINIWMNYYFNGSEVGKKRPEMLARFRLLEADETLDIFTLPPVVPGLLSRKSTINRESFVGTIDTSVTRKMSKFHKRLNAWTPFRFFLYRKLFQPQTSSTFFGLVSPNESWSSRILLRGVELPFSRLSMRSCR